ncbi:hypothetical protein EIM70_22610 [Salmonella enterica]|uniref:hypothetical protein n=1 Tax=Klebsiella pneumoniae TaxID=573 RepID=UPI00127C0012|nr:hypothetical protein [Salmonella enterica]
MKKSVGIRTSLLAQMAGIREAELVHALQTTHHFWGVKIPDPLPQRANAKTRNFDYEEAKVFAEKINAIREQALRNAKT